MIRARRDGMRTSQLAALERTSCAINPGKAFGMAVELKVHPGTIPFGISTLKAAETGFTTSCFAALYDGTADGFSGAGACKQGV